MDSYSNYTDLFSRAYELILEVQKALDNGALDNKTLPVGEMERLEEIIFICKDIGNRFAFL